MPTTYARLEKDYEDAAREVQSLKKKLDEVRSRLREAVEPIMKALNAETPGCPKCIDPERGPRCHDHDRRDCLEILGRTLLMQADAIRAALKDVDK